MFKFNDFHLISSLWIRFYLIAYMNIKWMKRKHSEKLWPCVPLAMRHIAIIFVFNLGTIRLQWRRETDSETHSQKAKNQIHFSFLEIEKNWIILFTAVFSAVVFQMMRASFVLFLVTKMKKVIEKKSGFWIERRTVVLFIMAKDEKRFGDARIVRLSSPFAKHVNQNRKWNYYREYVLQWTALHRLNGTDRFLAIIKMNIDRRTIETRTNISLFAMARQHSHTRCRFQSFRKRLKHQP